MTRIIRTRTKAARGKATVLYECVTVPGSDVKTPVQPCRGKAVVVTWRSVAEAVTSATFAFKAPNNGVSHIPSVCSESD